MLVHFVGFFVYKMDNKKGFNIFEVEFFLELTNSMLKKHIRKNGASELQRGKLDPLERLLILFFFTETNYFSFKNIIYLKFFLFNSFFIRI